MEYQRRRNKVKSAWASRADAPQEDKFAKRIAVQCVAAIVIVLALFVIKNLDTDFARTINTNVSEYLVRTVDFKLAFDNVMEGFNAAADKLALDDSPDSSDDTNAREQVVNSDKPQPSDSAPPATIDSADAVEYVAAPTPPPPSSTMQEFTAP